MNGPTVPYAVGRDNVTDISTKRAEKKLAVLETPDASLILERERTDAAWTAVSGRPAPLTEREARQKVDRRLDRARPYLLKAFAEVDHDDLRDLQKRLAGVIDELDQYKASARYDTRENGKARSFSDSSGVVSGDMRSGVGFPTDSDKSGAVPSPPTATTGPGSPDFHTDGDAA